jgi:hypothetical protein
LIAISLAGPLCGAMFGALDNAINGIVSPDYFAIVMSWDWADASRGAIARGAIEGASMGLAFSFFYGVTIAASTRMCCPPGLALRGLGIALTIVELFWIVGGVIGTGLAIVRPKLWGFFFIGVPPRVDLPRFAWVGGSICGAYGGTVIALAIAGVWVHFRWKRMSAPAHAFAVVQRAQGV